MMRVFVAAAALLFPSFAFAQTADLQIVPSIVFNPTRVLLGGDVNLQFDIHNNGPSDAHDVRVHFDPDPRWINAHMGVIGMTCNGRDCTVASVGAGFTPPAFFQATAPAVAGTFSIRVTVTSSTTDPNPADNTRSFDIDVVDTPALSVTLRTAGGYSHDQTALLPDFGTILRPEQRGILVAKIGNSGTIPATGVVLTIDLPSDAKVVGRSGGDAFDCSLEPTHITCRTPSVPVSKDPTTIQFTFINPPRYDGDFVKATAQLTANEPNLDPKTLSDTDTWTVARLLRVTTVADDGPGSLRDAIRTANETRNCGCVIGIRIPPPLPPSGFFTIQPRSPLPRFSGLLDGEAEVDLLGTDFTKPLVMLDGSLQSSGDGFTNAATLYLLGFAIGNFPRYGVTGTDLRIYDSYIGIDPSGHTAAPNLRGVVVDAFLLATNCVISGNRRSGVVSRGAVLVQSCRIGVAADSDAPVPNGASGIYMPEPSMTEIYGSVIAWNHEFALALHPQQHDVTIVRTSMWNNGAGIDYGLDGRTPNVDDDSHRPPNFPIVQDAHYDATKGQTIITILLTSKPSAPLEKDPYYTKSVIVADVFSNEDPNGQAQHYLGTTTDVLTIDGDLRGQTITAITRRTRADCFQDECPSISETSEISVPVPVR